MLLKLWKENSDWGEITEKDFTEWFINTPYDKVEIIVLVDQTDHIFGQIVFTPCRIWCNGKLFKAVRISAPIIQKDFRSIKYSLNHPVLKLYNAGMNVLKEKGFDIVYAYPAKGWLTALRGLQLLTGLRWKTRFFETCSIEIDHEVICNKYSLAKTTGFSMAYDHFFHQVTSERNDFCGIVRSSKWLQYKLGDFINFELRNNSDSALLGYISVRPRDGLLSDFLCLDEKTGKILIRMALNELSQDNALEIKKMIMMRSPFMNEVIKEFNTIPVDYKFGFGYCILNPELSKYSDHLDKWYNMPLD